MTTLKPSNLTPSQRNTLLRLRSAQRRSPDRTVNLNDFGSPSSVGHLIRKGAVFTSYIEIGTRGGKHPHVALTSEGERVADYIVVNRLKTY